MESDGLFVFVDSDIDEEELKTLRKKIKRIHRKKLSKKSKEVDNLSSSSLSNLHQNDIILHCIVIVNG